MGSPRLVRAFAAAVAASLLCLGPSARAGSADAEWVQVLEGKYGGISGLALDGPSGECADYIAVHDNKGPSEPHMSLLHVTALGTVMIQGIPCRVASGAVLPADCEAVCALPGVSHEFVVVGKAYSVKPTQHLLCHVVLSRKEAVLERIVPLTHVPAIDPDVEAFAVRRIGETTVAVWAHRGGGDRAAVVYAGRLDFGAKEDADVLRLDAPGQDVTVDFFPGCTDRRSVSDVKIDATGTVWATAACEVPKMEGALYVLGHVSVGADGKASLALVKAPVAEGTFPERKVEALEIMPERGRRFLLGADDDEGGGWVRVPEAR